MQKGKKFAAHVLKAAAEVKKMLDSDSMKGCTNRELALSTGISRNVLQDVFKSTYGIGLGEYKLKRRMELAAQWIEEGKGVKEISILLRYATPSAFSKAFNKYYGIRPTVLAGQIAEITVTSRAK